MSRATVFDIQRFSLHDGPGIRTTVFLKGCPLACAWCQNPEGLDPAARLWNFDNLCLRCGDCVRVCPKGALSPAADGTPRIDHSRCVLCGACAGECLANALAVVGFDVGDDELARRFLDDRLFFAVSGGGVTFSGGEPLAWAAFVRDVAERLRGEGVATAVETSLYAPWESVEALLEVVDVFHLDLKLFDGGRHRAATGVGNAPILENFRRLVGRIADRERIRVRIPLIPGFTDDAENLRAIAGFVAGIDPTLSVELMNYNPLGESKYRRMGMAYGVSPSAKPYSDGEMEAFRRLVRTRLGNVL